jgi:hypothetical protein
MQEQQRATESNREPDKKINKRPSKAKEIILNILSFNKKEYLIYYYFQKGKI